MNYNIAQIEAAIAQGIIIETADAVEIGAKASPTGVAVLAPYRRFQPLTLEAMIILAGGKVEPATARPPKGEVDNRTDAEKAAGVCDYFDYGFDLDVRAEVRNAKMTELEGPEKAIAKAVKAMVEGGYDEAEAREAVIAQRKRKGLPV